MRIDIAWVLMIKQEYERIKWCTDLFYFRLLMINLRLSRSCIRLKYRRRLQTVHSTLTRYLTTSTDHSNERMNSIAFQF